MSRRLSRRHLLSLAGGAVLGAPIASMAPEFRLEAAGRPSGTLTFWWWGEQLAPGLKDYVAGASPKFQAQYPGTNVNAVLQASEALVPGFTSACQAKQGADVQFMWSGQYAMQYVFRGCVKAASDVLGADELKHRPPASLSETKYQGKVWGDPWFASPHLLVYNKAAFTKAGLDPDKPPRKWSEFLVAVQKLQGAGYVPWGWGVRGITGIANVVGLLNMQQLDDITELLPVITGKTPYTDPRFSGWLQWIEQLRDLHAFNDDVTSLDYSQGQDLLSSGRAAMIEAGGAQVADYAKKIGVQNVGLMLPPIVGTGKLAGKMSNSSEQLLVTDWANIDLAAAFLKFLHTPAQLSAMYSGSGAIPTDDRFALSSPKVPQHRLLAEWLKTSSMSIYTNVWPAQMDRGNLFLVVQSLMGGKLTAPAAAQQIDSTLKDWRAQNPDLVKNFESWASSQ